MDDWKHILREVYGYDGFRPGQAEAVSAAAAGRDALVLLPTGSGKSLCYQLPAIARARAGLGPTLVVSPLIALMEDQLAGLRARGVVAVALHSGMSAEATREARAQLHDAALLYASPERLANARFRRTLLDLGVSAVAVDEAHCIAEWGHDFRPEYRQLGVLKTELQVPFMAVTATATPRTLREIHESLGLRDPLLVTGTFSRPNLAFSVEHHQGERTRTARVVALAREGLAEGGRVLIYAATRKRVVALAEALKADGLRAGWYHAGRTDLARARAQTALHEGKTPILVATNAFGMGVDLPDVRMVIHANAPGTLEGWVQEAGRAGRDGAPARCVLLYGASDALTHARLRGKSPRPGVEAGWRALQAVVFGDTCRQVAFHEYFGGIDGAACGVCDVCTRPSAVEAEVESARDEHQTRKRARDSAREIALSLRLNAEEESIILDFVGHLAKPAGATLVAAALRGSRAKLVLRRKLDENPRYGALRHLPEITLQDALQELLDRGSLARKGKKYPTLWLADRPVRPRREGAPRVARTGLSAALRRLRTAEARKRKWKPYQVFPDAVMEAILAARPASLEALEALPGMGPKRVERYGPQILSLIAENPEKSRS